VVCLLFDIRVWRQGTSVLWRLPFLFSGNLAICGALVPESEFVMTETKETVTVCYPDCIEGCEKLCKKTEEGAPENPVFSEKALEYLYIPPGKYVGI
jgi:hypothetical protein